MGSDKRAKRETCVSRIVYDLRKREAETQFGSPSASADNRGERGGPFEREREDGGECPAKRHDPILGASGLSRARHSASPRARTRRLDLLVRGNEGSPVPRECRARKREREKAESSLRYSQALCITVLLCSRAQVTRTGRLTRRRSETRESPSYADRSLTIHASRIARGRP